MTPLQKISIVIVALLIALAVAVGLISINHPIILKWVTGSARHHGGAIPAEVYTNGKANPIISVYYTDEPGTYLVSLGMSDSLGILEVIHIDLNDKSISRPVSTSKNDYDLIAGHLFQSKTATDFLSLHESMTAQAFDPQFTAADNQIKFTMPPNTLRIDSIRIILP